ncbi:cellulose biosynthesis cyclic di-GMP-binding regulatory protein BcsB, partial [Enterobacter hormaechei]|uniref:cellulose biosynthesis cyclic di-GMP-binding regulatory protein BcsB n=1 Tax=Enterobacter hormaechei TaxID=158836 RepID=UPI00197B0449
LGKPNRIQMVIDPRYITDFNRVRLVFVGHYQNICENPASTSLWLDVSKSSALKIAKEQLGKPNRIQMVIDPRYITDFNRVRLVFVGHYQNI